MIRRAERGFALLVVLWVMVFLAFLMTQILGSGRTAVTLAGNLRAAAQARAADDGAINEAVFHLLGKGAGHWPADGTAHTLQIGAVPVTVRAASLGGMVNPNLASAGLLQGLLEAVGAGPDQASGIANAIVAWRSPPSSPTAGAAADDAYRRAGLPYGPPGRPFAALGELVYVAGMTPAIYAALRDHLSLYQPGDPDPNLADPVVTKALSLANGIDPNGGAYQGPPVLSITACALAAASACRRAVVSLPGINAPTPFRILTLDNG